MRTALVLGAVLLSGCAVSGHATVRSTLGVVRSSDDLVAALASPGEATVETVVGCDWEVDLAGLVNLDHPRAKEAGLTDRAEPIQIYFHAIRHPGKGLFLVDTGVERALRDDPSKSAIGSLMRSYVKAEKMKNFLPLGEWLAKSGETVQGVFLTHLHFDHLTGMPDLPEGTTVYTGPGESAPRSLQNLVVQPSTDRALAGKTPVQEWAFAPDPAGRFDGVLDVFGDGTVWAIWAPGHTVGSTAFLVRTPAGPVLLTGDVSHTRWGWDHGVEPGGFSDDRPRNRDSLLKLKKLVAEHPEIDVRLGHQR